MSDDTALTVYVVALWLAFVGMVLFEYANPVTRHAKIAGAVIFVLMCVDMMGIAA